MVQGLETGSDVAVAFALVIAAGMSTTVGAAFAFCAKLADARTLSIALGASAGVMLYVSFAEIFLDKSVEGFKDEGHEEHVAKRYSTFCFFAGLLFTALLNGCVHFIYEHYLNTKSESDQATKNETETKETDEQSAAQDIEAVPKPQVGRSTLISASFLSQEFQDACCLANYENIIKSDVHAYHLQRVGLMSGLAVALHNFPEGLATFISYLADPTAGVAIAIAIALHNIPEGVVVAMPVFYATKSRLRGFVWAVLSGVSEPLGAFFGWIVLSNLGDLAYAIMFGIVAGMMIYISVRELIPTALRFDPEDNHVTISVFLGMAVMAASLLLFNA